jgi:prepilin-type N-terminal cleavage/methylation domain-containing protein
MKMPRPSFAESPSGFSLVELMVSMTILTAIMLLFVGILDQLRRPGISQRGKSPSSAKHESRMT